MRKLCLPLLAAGLLLLPACSGDKNTDKAALAEETPLGALGTPKQVADALVFLAGDRASYITGQVLGVNGGLVT